MAQILLADDDPSTRDLVKRSLEMDGHSVTVSQDGGEALAVIRARADLEVLVTDVDMPVIDGIKLAREAVSMRPSLRVLMISGFPEQLEQAGTVKAYRLSVLAKPFTLDKARAAVRDLLA